MSAHRPSRESQFQLSARLKLSATAAAHTKRSRRGCPLRLSRPSHCFSVFLSRQLCAQMSAGGSKAEAAGATSADSCYIDC